MHSIIDRKHIQNISSSKLESYSVVQANRTVEADGGVVVKAITRATATAAKPFAILNAGPRKHHIDANRHK
jgi:hypothetical protein